MTATADNIFIPTAGTVWIAPLTSWPIPDDPLDLDLTGWTQLGSIDPARKGRNTFYDADWNRVDTWPNPLLPHPAPPRLPVPPYTTFRLERPAR
ncbi:hypothetical protein ACWEQ4_00850 [Rhodococcus sp. NPDC003994]